MVKLPDPRDCPKCGKKVDVVRLDTRHRRGAIRRTHRCSTCKVKWRTYETIVDPLDLPPKLVDGYRPQ
jgi:transcriptional regulator NrdR family protein